MSQKRLLAYVEKLYGVQGNIERKLQEKKAQEADKFKMSGTDFEAVVYDSLIGLASIKNLLRIVRRNSRILYLKIKQMVIN